jgi:subtilisin family serine protease
MRKIGAAVILSVVLIFQSIAPEVLGKRLFSKARDPRAQDWKVDDSNSITQAEVWNGEALLASPDPKIAPDLWKKVKQSVDAGRGEDILHLVVRTDGAPSSSIVRHVLKHQGRVLSFYDNLDMLTVDVPASEVEGLVKHHRIRSVSPDRTVSALATYDSHIRRASGVTAALASSNLSGLTGKGLGIAIIDSGVQTDHFALAASKAPSGPGFVSVSLVTGDKSTEDAYGHGTHVASLAAGPGQNLGNYTGLYTGVAYNSRVLNVRVLGADGTGHSSDVIAGINWCISNKIAQNIRVINLSLGALTPESYTTDPLCQAAERAVQAGIVVVAAAGNNGKDSTGATVYGGIDSPGIDPMVITVGATNTHGTDPRSDDSIASYSSRGPTYADRLLKPDLVAPGNALVGAESYKSFLVTNYPQLNFGTPNDPKLGSLMTLNGTSMAVPIVSGIVGLMLEKNPVLTPGLVKAILQYTAQHLPSYNLLEQGAGEVNGEGALRLAAAIKPTLPIVGAPLLGTSMPAEQSVIAGETFNWFGHIYGSYNHVLSGSALFQKYQQLYTVGFCWVGDQVTINGLVMTNGHLLSDSVNFADGFLLADGILFNNGIAPANGPLASGLDVSNAHLLADGHLLADAIVFSNATVMPDGYLLADVFVGPASFTALSDSTLVYGEP